MLLKKHTLLRKMFLMLLFCENPLLLRHETWAADFYYAFGFWRIAADSSSLSPSPRLICALRLAIKMLGPALAC